MRSLLFCISLLCTAASSHAKEAAGELVLLTDPSGSITEDEIQFQRSGYAEALTDPRVRGPVESTLHGLIAVVYVERADRTAVVADGMKIEEAKTAAAFAEDVLAPPSLLFGRNAIGDAPLSGKRLIEENTFNALRKVIDLSGDRLRNFAGRSIGAPRDEVVDAGITINALPIVCGSCDRAARYPNLAGIHEQTTIGRPGVFKVTASSQSDLAAATRRDLTIKASGKTPETIVAYLD